MTVWTAPAPPAPKPPRGVYPNIPERGKDGWQVQVNRTLGFCGFTRLYHTWISVHSEAGFPDVVALRLPTATRPGRIVYVECKGFDGKVTDEQQRWLDDLEAASPGNVFVSWPGQQDELVAFLGAS